METGTVKSEEVGGVIVLSITGYFNEITGKTLRNDVMGHLEKGKKRFVLDLSGCNLMNSPGVASVLKMGIAVKEDFLGSMAICGASAILTNVLTLVEISSCATMEKDLPGALKKVREG